MASTPLEEGLQLIDLDADGDADDADLETVAVDGDGLAASRDDLETLRDELVDAFNARDLEAVLGLVAADVECPEADGDGAEALAAQLTAIWDRAPAAMLTRAFLDGSPCAVAWLPDEDGCWSRVTVVLLDGEDDLLTLVTLPDDPDALDRAVAEDPAGEEIEEGSDWGEWDRGEATEPRSRKRQRP